MIRGDDQCHASQVGQPVSTNRLQSLGEDAVRGGGPQLRRQHPVDRLRLLKRHTKHLLLLDDLGLVRQTVADPVFQPVEPNTL